MFIGRGADRIEFHCARPNREAGRPKVFDILLMLVQNSGHIVSKDDVMKRVWSDTAVEDGNISRTTSTLREVLVEGPREQRYIETIPWQGYQFVATVREVLIEQQWKAIESIAVLPFVNAAATLRLISLWTELLTV
jgi:DNA-binding winged helix-turn-helix (wHTH) protein